MWLQNWFWALQLYSRETLEVRTESKACTKPHESQISCKCENMVVVECLRCVYCVHNIEMILLKGELIESDWVAWVKWYGNRIYDSLRSIGDNLHCKSDHFLWLRFIFSVCNIRFALVYLVKFQRNTTTCSELRR